MKSLLGWTHDPQTGETLPRVEPPQHPLAQHLLSAMGNAQLPDAYAFTYTPDSKKFVGTPMERSARAAVNVAAQLYRAGKIEPKQVVSRVSISQFNGLLHRQVKSLGDCKLIGTGMGASTGAAAGYAVLSVEQALTQSQAGFKNLILVVDHTTPEDMAALDVVSAIVTKVGGYTSHAAIVARQKGVPCVVGIDWETPPKNGDTITVIGTTGEVHAGQAEFTEGELDDNMHAILHAANSCTNVSVFANADTAEDVKLAVKNKAKGVGLCRTEHTFFTTYGTLAIRKLILAHKETEKTAATDHIEQLQTEHFIPFFKALENRDATIRLLDPPLHEFLPKPDDKDTIAEIAKSFKLKKSDVADRIVKLQETNPMMGHRGCRLAVTISGLYEAQTRGILRAAKAAGYTGTLGIMVPFIVDVAEARYVNNAIRKAHESFAEIHKDEGLTFEAKFGVMLETPRACLQTYQLAEFVDFFSFGTNDLTQFTWALSRDDGHSFLGAYHQKSIFTDPFLVLDSDGVGALMAHAISSLKDRRSKVTIGICGEHGGDPRSIAFCHGIGLDYVSCSPLRVPPAILASAQAAVKALDETLAPVAIDIPAEALPSVKKDLPVLEINSSGAPSGLIDVDFTPSPAFANINLENKPKIDPKKGSVIPPDDVKLNIDNAVQHAKLMVADIAKMALENFKKPKEKPEPVGTKVPDPHADVATKVVKPKPVAAQPPMSVAEVAALFPGKKAEPLKSYGSVASPEDFAKAKQFQGEIGTFTSFLAGQKVSVKHPKGTGVGIVVGYVPSPHMKLLALRMEGMGHNGAELASQIKWVVPDTTCTNIWYASMDEVSSLEG